MVQYNTMCVNRDEILTIGPVQLIDLVGVVLEDNRAIFGLVSRESRSATMLDLAHLETWRHVMPTADKPSWLLPRRVWQAVNGLPFELIWSEVAWRGGQ